MGFFMDLPKRRSHVLPIDVICVADRDGSNSLTAFVKTVVRYKYSVIV
jgi:hypothetical protein